MREGKLKAIQKRHRGRCSGHCCQRFYLPYSPDELENKYILWTKLQGQRHKMVPLSMNRGYEFGAEGSTPIDIHIVFPMLIYLGEGDKHMPPQTNEVPKEPGERRHYYTCVHWDSKTGNCGIYEHRPQMCREYPYRQDCNYAHCTWKERKQKKKKPEKELGQKYTKACLMEGD